MNVEKFLVGVGHFMIAHQFEGLDPQVELRLDQAQSGLRAFHAQAWCAEHESGNTAAMARRASGATIMA